MTFTLLQRQPSERLERRGRHQHRRLNLAERVEPGRSSQRRQARSLPGRRGRRWGPARPEMRRRVWAAARSAGRRWRHTRSLRRSGGWPGPEAAGSGRRPARWSLAAARSPLSSALAVLGMEPPGSQPAISMATPTSAQRLVLSRICTHGSPVHSLPDARQRGGDAPGPQARARSSSSARSRALRVSAAARSNSARASSWRPSFDQQVAAHARQQVVALRAPARRRARRRARGPPRARTPSPTATARLSSTTGERRELGERVVERGDPLPVGVLGRARRGRGRRRSRPAARTGRAAPPSRSARSSAAEAAADQQPVPARAVLVEQQDRLARRADPRARSATPGSPSARPARAPRARAARARRGCGPSRSASSHSAGRIQSSPAVAE